YIGGTKLGQATSSPYSLSWSAAAAGSYALTARATDNQGGTSTARPVNVTVVNPNTPPAVSVSSPTNNATFTASANITITADASDGDGTISRVEFYDGGTKLGQATTSPYSLSWSAVAAGSYALTARATDN